MVVTESSLLPLGFKLPDFILFDVMTQKTWKMSDIADGEKPVLVIFMCNHCPYVKHVEEEIAEVAKTYFDRISTVAVSSNDVSYYPEDNPDNLKAQGDRLEIAFPYFYDDRQEVAKSFKAACTPDFYLFNRDLELVYHGQLDDSRPGNHKETNGSDLRMAIEAVLQDKEIDESMQKPSVGCNIKWKPGNEPDYVDEI